MKISETAIVTSRVWKKVQTLLNEALSIGISPECCCVCGRVLVEGEKYMCLHCLMSLPRTTTHLHARNIIHKRLTDEVPVRMASAWFEYHPQSQYASLIRRAKYADCPSLAYELGRMYAAELLKNCPEIRKSYSKDVEAGNIKPNSENFPMMLDTIDVLLPVPMHYRKILQRGYNQSVEIARGIGAVADIPVGDNLVAVRSHHTQTRRSFEERRKNIAGAIAVEHASELQGMNIAIVDDVFTSGATVTECAKAVFDAVPDLASVNVLVLGLAGGM